jgi:hypothetical protein
MAQADNTSLLKTSIDGHFPCLSEEEAVAKYHKGRVVLLSGAAVKKFTGKVFLELLPRLGVFHANSAVWPREKEGENHWWGVSLCGSTGKVAEKGVCARMRGIGEKDQIRHPLKYSP